MRWPYIIPLSRQWGDCKSQRAFATGLLLEPAGLGDGFEEIAAEGTVLGGVGTRRPTIVDHPWAGCPSAQIVMKYHAAETSIDNGPRWSNRFRTGRAACPHAAVLYPLMSSAMDVSC